MQKELPKTSLQLNLEKMLSDAKSQNDKLLDTFFYDGNYKDTLKKCLLNNFPNGSVAVFFTMQSFKKYGEEFNDILKLNGNNAKNFIVENEQLSINSVSKYSIFAEEVRAIICTDKSIIDICTYLASVYNLKLIILYNTIFYPNLICTRVLFYGKNIDYIQTRIERHILIDLNEIINNGDERKESFAFIISNLISLYDYKINCLINNKSVNQLAFTFAYESISETYKVMKQPLYGQYLLLVTLFIKLCFANFITDGELLDFSSIKSANFLCEEKNSKNSIYFLKIYIKLLALSIQNNNGLLFENDYNKINEQLKDITYAQELDLLKSLLNQSEIYNEKNKFIIEELKKDSNEIDNLIANIEIIEKTFILLGGEKIPPVNMKNKNLLFALTHAGDLPYCFNLATFLRELGVFEFIK